MPIFFSITIMLVLGVLLGRYLTEWLSNRPDPSPEYSQEEILAEMDEVFVERDILSFTVRTDSVPVLLQRMTESVGLGFGAQQAETLAHRVVNQRLNDYYQATYPLWSWVGSPVILSFSGAGKARRRSVWRSAPSMKCFSLRQIPLRTWPSNIRPRSAHAPRGIHRPGRLGSLSIPS